MLTPEPELFSSAIAIFYVFSRKNPTASYRHCRAVTSGTNVIRGGPRRDAHRLDGQFSPKISQNCIKSKEIGVFKGGSASPWTRQWELHIYGNYVT